MIRVSFRGAATAAGALAIGVFLGAQALSEPSKNPVPQLQVDDSPLETEIKARTSFAPVVKAVAPCVVNIYTTERIEMPSGSTNPFFNHPLFREFFGQPDEESDSRSRRPRTRVQQSLGSGVIVTKDGYILTNHHVVSSADEVKVVLADGGREGKEYTAKVIGTDPQTEIAVLRVEAEDLPAVTIGDSDTLEVGDLVLAIGNPFGVGQTVTMGMVSAIDRGGFSIPGLRYQDFIQTDASINPGNSGGALVDAQGRVVGINTFIISQSGGNAGIGFAIPINLARQVMDQLTREGKVTRGWLGVEMEQNITEDLVAAFDLPNDKGVLVTAVVKDSPAQEAGFEEGDFIIELDGKRIEDNRDLQFAVAQRPPGSEVKVRVLREGKETELTVVLGELDLASLRSSTPSIPSRVNVLQGVEISDLTPSLREQFSIPEETSGALVTEVSPDSKAYEAGLRPGTAILGVNRQPIESAREARRLIADDADGSVLLRVRYPNGGTRFLVIEQDGQE